MDQLITTIKYLPDYAAQNHDILHQIINDLASGSAIVLQPRFDITELRRKIPNEAVYKTVPTEERCRNVATEHAQVNVQVSVIKICRSISSDMEVIERSDCD